MLSLKCLLSAVDEGFVQPRGIPGCCGPHSRDSSLRSVRLKPVSRTSSSSSPLSLQPDSPLDVVAGGGS